MQQSGRRLAAGWRGRGGMLLTLAALAGVVVGWGRGGRLGAIARVRLTGMPLLAAALAMVVLARTPLATPDASRLLESFAYLAAIAVLWQNRRHPWALPILAGLSLNALAIALNGGRMPVSQDALSAAGRALDLRSVAALDPRHSVAGPGTRLAPLGDVFAVSVARMGAVLSLGDLLMAVGLAGFVQHEMRARRQPSST